MKALIIPFCAIVAGIIGYLTSDFFKWQADLAVRLRPELANFTFWEAFWSGHFYEWVWYTNKTNGIMMLIFLGLLFGLGIWLKLEDD